MGEKIPLLASQVDLRFSMDPTFLNENQAGSSEIKRRDPDQDGNETDSCSSDNGHESDGQDAAGAFDHPGSENVVKPLTPETLAAFQAAQDRAGVIYISRIPPGMRPAKVRHLMSAYGEVGRVYLQQEDAKRAYLRRKHTSTKKPHFTEGWVEFKDKCLARSVAQMLNAQPIGGRKGTRWRDDVWTMKYLPRFKWNMLTEQIAHEAAVHTARLRVELTQSRKEQQDYLRQVELARVLDKRAKRKRKVAEEKGEMLDEQPVEFKRRRPPTHPDGLGESSTQQKRKTEMVSNAGSDQQLQGVLGSVF